MKVTKNSLLLSKKNTLVNINRWCQVSLKTESHVWVAKSKMMVNTFTGGLSLLNPIILSNLLSKSSNIPCQLIYRGLRTIKKRSNASASLTKTEILDDLEKDQIEYEKNKKFFDKVNQEIKKASDKERLFAICHLYGKQYLFSEGDMIILQKYFPAEMGARVKLEKVMMVGSSEFSLFGRPILNRDLVNVEATLMERTMSQTNTYVHHVSNHGKYRRWHFQRFPLSILRINRIKICHPLNESQSEVH